MINTNTIQKQYFEWLSNEVSKAQMSEFYIAYVEIENFCFQHNILRGKLFENTITQEIESVCQTVKSNKLFHFTYKRKYKKMCSAIQYYYQFLKGHSELYEHSSCVKEQSPQQDKEKEMHNLENLKEKNNTKKIWDKGNSDISNLTTEILSNQSLEQQLYNYEDEKSEMIERFNNILVKYFMENGYQLGRPIFRGRFKKNYFVEYGAQIQKSDEQIDELLCELGTLRDGRIFPKQDDSQNKIIENIITDILTVFESGVSAIYIDSVYEKYQELLVQELNIFNPDALTALLMENAEGHYSNKFSYLIANSQVADSAGDLLHVMKEFYEPKTYYEIHKVAWYIPFNKMKNLLVKNKLIVKVDEETYFYAPNFHIDENELKKLIIAIRRELVNREYITDVDILEIIRREFPNIATNAEGFTTYGLRNCLGYILREYFSFRGPIISTVGKELSMADVYAGFAKSHKTMHIEDLKNFSNEIEYGIYWEAVLGEMIRVSENEFVRKDLISFDVELIDSFLNEICLSDYVALKNVGMFLHFPNIGYSWNVYVLESYLNSFSKKFKLIHASFGQNSVCGAMVRVDSSIVDYRSLLVDVLSKSNALESSKEALQYIVDYGLQQRRRYNDIIQLIKEAKLLKEKTEK